MNVPFNSFHLNGHILWSSTDFFDSHSLTKECYSTFSFYRIPAKLVADWFVQLDAEGLEARVTVRVL